MTPLHHARACSDHHVLEALGSLLSSHMQLRMLQHWAGSTHQSEHGMQLAWISWQRIWRASGLTLASGSTASSHGPFLSLHVLAQTCLPLQVHSTCKWMVASFPLLSSSHAADSKTGEEALQAKPAPAPAGSNNEML